MRQVLQRPRQRNQHDDNQSRKGQLRELAACAGVVGHCRLRRTAVDNKCSGDRGSRIGYREPQNVSVLVDALLVTLGVDARSRRALGDDHHETGGCDGQEHKGFIPGDVWPAQRGQSSWDGADGRNAVTGEIERGARRDHANDDDHRHRKAWRETAAKQNGGDDQNRQSEVDSAQTRQPQQDILKLDERSVGIDGDAKHVRKHGHADLNAHAGEKADQRRTRKKIREKAQFENPR